MSNEIQIPKRLIVSSVFGILALIIAIAIGGNSFETVDKGEYQIRQRWVSGTMAVKMSPGMWSQFGDVTTFPKSETFFFTAGKYEGEDYDQSIKIQFADGSYARTSGTLRIVLPTSPSEAIALVKDLNFSTYLDVERTLVLPVVRKSLNATAKLMTARESYSERYNEFIAHAIYQIENGLYITKSVDRKVIDPLSGEEVTVRFQDIQYNEDGTPMTQQNSLEGTGIVLKNFEIEEFKYDAVVLDQIATQQKAMMAVDTKKLEAQEAEQEKIKITAIGKAAVEKAKYEKEVEKIEAVTAALKNKEVAELKASQELEVAKLAKLAAVETKAKDILLGEGEAKRKALVMQADGALKQKLAAIVQMNKDNATALGNRAVPSTYFAGNADGSGNGYDDEMVRQLRLLNMNAINSLGLDLDVKSKDK